MIPCIAKSKSCKEIPNAIGGHPVESVQTEVVLKRDLKICAAIEDQWIWIAAGRAKLQSTKNKKPGNNKPRNKVNRNEKGATRR